MSGSKKYLRRPDLGGVVIEIEASLLEIVRQHLDLAGLPYEVLDAAPEPEKAGEDQSPEPEKAGEDQSPKRRRSS